MNLKQIAKVVFLNVGPSFLWGFVVATEADLVGKRDSSLEWSFKFPCFNKIIKIDKSKRYNSFNEC